jgi:hypothetical protein
MAVRISTDSDPGLRASIRMWLLAGCVAVVGARTAFAADGKALIDEVWSRYRAVQSERQESEILVVSAPQAAPYSRADVESLLRAAPASVAHKRAVHHVHYAPDLHDQLHILFSLPAEDAGLGLLVAREPDGAQDQMWLYMPGYHRVRRIPASSDQRFAGTDLIYEDVRAFLGEHTEAFEYSAPAADRLDARAMDVVVATPKDGTATSYGRRKIFIDKAWLFPVRVELDDPQGRPWKVLRHGEIREVAPGVRRADVIEMRDLQRQSATLVLVTKRAVGVAIPPQVFTEDYLVHPGSD